MKLLSAQPWLADGLGAAERTRAADELNVPTFSAPVGPWAAQEHEPVQFGLLILSGLVLRETVVRSHRAAELVGAGDLIRPWSYEGAAAPVPGSATWRVLADSQIAILDRAFARAVQRWPQLAATMLEQAVERTRMQAYLVAARGAVRVEERLLLTFWHLADRWGRVGPDGTTIEVPHLTHEMLADLVGARRPPTTLALGRLRERGDIDRRDGLWVLRGQPPAK